MGAVQHEIENSLATDFKDRMKQAKAFIRRNLEISRHLVGMVADPRRDIKPVKAETCQAPPVGNSDHTAHHPQLPQEIMVRTVLRVLAEVKQQNSLAEFALLAGSASRSLGWGATP